MSMSMRGENCKLMFDGERSRSRTHQSFAKDADINVIMARYKKTGVLVDPLLMSSGRRPRFGDFSDIPEYSVLLSRMQQAQSDFMTLPSDVRARFHNDVSECLDFVSEPKNLKESVELGLISDKHPMYVELVANEVKAAEEAATGTPVAVTPPASK